MNKLVCTDLQKNYDKKEVLKSVNLTIESGKIYGLIGKNGAGKTTLLGLLSGQNPATSGTITLDGSEVWENQLSVDQICFSREISPTAFGMTADSRNAKQIIKTASCLFPYWDKEYAAALIEAFGIDIKKRISQMSKGMLSALCIMIGLASKAPLTFLDEPVAGLDVFAREKFYGLLLEEFSVSGRTFIISTHIIDEAAKAFEEVIILDDGKVVLKENTEELLGRYRLVSGRDDEVDALVRNYRVVHTETLGRTKSVCVEIGDMKRFKDDATRYDVDISSATLQKLFMELVGE